jgi:hypothetical protein
MVGCHRPPPPRKLRPRRFYCQTLVYGYERVRGRFAIVRCDGSGVDHSRNRWFMCPPMILKRFNRPGVRIAARGVRAPPGDRL